MHEDAAKFYHAILMTTTMGEEARNYLYQRGLTDEVLKHFWIGLAPPERNYLYQRLSDQYREEDLLDSGLFYLSDANQFVDTFHNRIMFPLTNDQGKVIAFSGRIWQKRIHKLLSIKTADRLQFLTKVTNYIIWIGQKIFWKS